MNGDCVFVGRRARLGADGCLKWRPPLDGAVEPSGTCFSFRCTVRQNQDVGSWQFVYDRMCFVCAIILVQ